MQHVNRINLGWLAVAGVLGMSVVLGGCQKTREAFGLEKSAPDEFAVVTRAPLSMPPDYGLRPPAPGMERPQEREVKDEARRLLVTSAPAPQSAEGAQPSAGESALLNRAGADRADPAIRQRVSRENQVLTANEGGFIDRLIFWQETPPPGVVLDPELEARRIRENAALGESVTKGPTPVITRKKRGILEGLF